MGAAIDRLEKDIADGDVAGVVVASAKKTFFAGGNLKAMVQAGPDDAAEIFAMGEAIKAQLRRLETCGKPVVAAINGTALGGGLEITLACHHRIAVDDPKIELGLPEVTLGLLPGGGGVTRVVRMLGLADGLMGVLLQGTRFKPAAAKEKGLVDALVADRDDLLPAAKAWITANRDNEEAATQPWDRPGYKMPGGTPSNPKLAAFLPAFPANLRKQLKGADFPAPRAIMSAAVEGAQVDFDTASRIESRYLTSLIVGQNSKDMIQAFFFDLQAINAGSLRPEGIDKWTPTKVGVLGAGMMGAGIAYSCARSGIEVVLKDVSVEAAEKGKSYSTRVLDKAISRGKMTEAGRDEVLARITPTGDPQDLAGCDLVIEAVFEDPSLKAKVFAEVQDVVNPDALLCSNTSTLPISGLAEGVNRPDDFIGLHFFSPVDKMPLVEIIRGAKTSDQAVARAIDVVQKIRKTPIVVNDSRGFYTSRVIGTQINEGLAMLGEGIRPMSIERAATQAGYPVGPLQISDELNMELMVKIRNATRDGRRAGGRHVHAARRRGGHQQDDRDRPPEQAQGRRLLRVRRVRQAPRALAGAGRDLPGGRRAAAARRPHRPQGPVPVHRGDRDRQVLRGGRDRVRRGGQHRLGHGHRLPAEHRRRRAVHAGLRGRADRVRRAGPGAGRDVRRAVHPAGVPRRPRRQRGQLPRLTPPRSHPDSSAVSRGRRARRPRTNRGDRSIRSRGLGMLGRIAR